jgi:hypothetical protein
MAIVLSSKGLETKLGGRKPRFFYQPVTSFIHLLICNLIACFFNYLWIVKLVRIILAIYITVLTVYPCSDPNTCIDELQNGVQVVGVSDHEHSDAERDVCTPFCICSCCAAHIRLSSGSDLDFAGVIHNTKEIVPYIERQSLSDHNHIWQPPRI